MPRAKGTKSGELRNYGRLVLIGGDGQEQVHLLTSPTTTLGSAETNDIVLGGDGVSRVHARVQCGDGGCTIVDLESAKGVLINGIAVQEAPLASADVILIGGTSLRFDAEVPASEADEAPPQVEVEPNGTVLDTGAVARLMAEAQAQARPGAKADAGATSQAEQQALPSDALVALQTGGTKRPLFCVAAGYRDVAGYMLLAQRLGADYPVYALQPPNVASATADPAAEGAVTLAAHYITHIRRIQPQGPYLLGGFDVGGLLAFEMAQQLRMADQQVGLLALWDTPFAMAAPTWYPSFRVAKMVDQATEMMMRPAAQMFHGGPAQRLLEPAGSLAQKVSSFFPASAKVRETFVDLTEVYKDSQGALKDRGLERHLRSLATYAPKLYDGRIRLFLAKESPVRLFGAAPGWQSIARGGIDEHLIPGRHDTMFKEPTVGIVAEHLRQYLEIAV